MTVVSNGQFWMYTVALLIVWIIVLTTAFNSESNINNKLTSPNDNNEDELKNTGNCKALCKHCGCLGFYCGEECICECNNDHKDTECISVIQTNAKSLNIPFEILIQGPTANTFVRNAFQFEQNNERKSFGYRNKRSTVTVYKPNKAQQDSHCLPNVHKIKSNSEAKTLVKDIFIEAKKVKERRKRSSNQFNWFNDLSNNLLRPAPLGGYKRKTEEPKDQNIPKTSTVSPIFDNSWFLHNTPNIITPAPLNKRKNTETARSDISQEQDEEDLSLEIIKKQTFHVDDDQLHDDFSDNPEIETVYSDELKSIKEKEKIETVESDNALTPNLYKQLYKADKISFLPETEKQEESMKTLTSGRFLKDNLSKTEDKHLFLSEEKELKEESQESLTKDLYSRLFKDDLIKLKEKIKLSFEEGDPKEESQEQLIGSLYARLFKDDLNKFEDKKLLSEESKKLESQEALTGSLYSRLFKEDTKISLPKKMKKGLHDLRIPWLKPGNFFEKVKKVIGT
ncbi:uncharacterized protein LOC111688487 [Lucilia cuprina]|uniref:uncharacterized protein LOC111688487 n=1 Tax=Lucilia cuprina TaxID=7375 RepID=UPI001F06AA30|nr:uncharacterized protein LOC111688487 [Lucilia cuprina]